MSRYRWVHHEGDKLYEVGILVASEPAPIKTPTWPAERRGIEIHCSVVSGRVWRVFE